MRVGSIDYSVDPDFIGYMCHVHMNLTIAWMTTDGTEVVRHPYFRSKASTVTSHYRVAMAAALISPISGSCIGFRI